MVGSQLLLVEVYKHWELVVCSRNQGDFCLEGRVRRLDNQQGSSDQAARMARLAEVGNMGLVHLHCTHWEEDYSVNMAAPRKDFDHVMLAPRLLDLWHR